MKNKGIRQYRFESNPLEKAFAIKWEELNNSRLIDILEYILSAEPNSPASVTDREREVAATIIQWLGSPVGFGFIKQVLKEANQLIKENTNDI